MVRIVASADSRRYLSFVKRGRDEETFTLQKTGKERIESNMESYTSFAEVYDQFMDNVPYEAWADFLQEILQKEGIRDGLVLDLGCGYRKHDGSTCSQRLRYDRGLTILRKCWKSPWKKRVETGHDILYLQQDMQAFELIWHGKSRDQCL